MKKVFVVSRRGCQTCEMLEYDLKYIHEVEFQSFSDMETPDIFNEFRAQFKINRFPVVQIDNGVGFTTIHMDNSYTPKESGTGSSIASDLGFIKVNNLSELLETTLKSLSK